jgi:hypothetical protein
VRRVSKKRQSLILAQQSLLGQCGLLLVGPCGKGGEDWWSIVSQIVGQYSLSIRNSHVGEITSLKEHADQVDIILLHCRVPTEMDRDHDEGVARLLNGYSQNFSQGDHESVVRHILTDGCDPHRCQVWNVNGRNLQESLADAGVLLQMFKSRKNQIAIL